MCVCVRVCVLRWCVCECVGVCTWFTGVFIYVNGCVLLLGGGERKVDEGLV